MTMTVPRVAIIAFLSLAGCGGSSEKADAKASAPPVTSGIATPAAGSSDPSASRSRCPHTGLWAQCSIENRLRQSGFVVKRLDEQSPMRAGFSVKPILYTLGKSRLEVFVYENEASLARDVSGLDTILVAPRGATATLWESQPVLVRSANIAAVLLNASPIQAERFSNALTAGPPQPGSPR